MFPSDKLIHEKENNLRKWFVRGLNKTKAVIDGFDIGWGGTAVWSTKKISNYINKDLNMNTLDVACGYGTFLVELGWRFPNAKLYGLNLDFNPPHKVISSLLEEANVSAQLIASDALFPPFRKESFDLITCFLGLQDIEITRGINKLGYLLKNLMNLIGKNNYLVIIDNFPLSKFNLVFEKGLIRKNLILQDSFQPICKWSFEIGKEAVELYSAGYLQQELIGENPPNNPEKALIAIKEKMFRDLKSQIEEKGYFNPWGTMTLFIFKK
ncbi:class I SAM-dependent methyltransferase [Candidatus Hodarchaeum mangrovi]